jgi:hypothetical protein
MQERIMNLWIKPQADLGACHKFDAGLGIAGREKRHIAPQIDPFAPAVKPRRAAFGETRNFGDLHKGPSFRLFDKAYRTAMALAA